MIYCDTAKLPQRRELDFYPTPSGAVLQILTWHRDQGHTPRSLLDLGAGGGVYGKVARTLWPDIHLTGVEIRRTAAPAEYDRWLTADLATWQPDQEWDLVAGNPPYFLAEKAVWRSLEALAPHGTAIHLLRIAFLAGQGRRARLYGEGLLRAVVVCSKRVSFSGDGKTDATDHAHFVFGRHSQRPPTLHWL